MKSRFFLFLALCTSIAAPSVAADLGDVGVKAPPIDVQQLLQAPDGSRATWDSLHGKVVVLEFWDTWCPSCINQIPHLNELADELKDEPVQFISVTDEDQKTILPFLARTPIHGWVGLNTTGSMFNTYGIDEGRPLTVIVRPDGVVDARIRPYSVTLTAQNLTNLVAGKPSGLVSSRIIYAGEVHDQQGNPIAGVTVTATNDLPNSSIEIAHTETDKDGHFRLPQAADPASINKYPIALNFSHPNFLFCHLEDLRLFSLEQQVNLHVGLRVGKSWNARVVDDAGHPVPGASVLTVFRESFLEQMKYPKFAKTDAGGRFDIQDLPSSTGEVFVLAANSRSPMLSGHASVDLRPGSTTRPDLIQLAPALPPGTTIHDFFGMKIAEANKDIQTSLFLPQPFGMLIVDPGPRAGVLGMPLSPGDCILAVGSEKPVTNFTEFAQRLLAYCDNQRLVIRHFNGEIFMWDLRGSLLGYMGDHLALTKADLAELRRWAK